MNLDGQVSPRDGIGRSREAGYAMAALLVGLSIMSVLLAVALPVWKQMTIREKEAELIFRGEQYKRAIGLFQRRAGPGVLPPSIDLLVEQRFLRKAYKDPITGEEFALIRQAVNVNQQPQGAGPPGSSTGRGGNRGQPPPPTARGGSIAASGSASRGGDRVVLNTSLTAVGGIQGVTSKSTEQSIRLYNGRNRYDQWEFVFVPQVQAPGVGRAPGAGGPGQPGGPPLPPGSAGGRGRGGPGRGNVPFPSGFPSRGGGFPPTPPGGGQPPQRPPGR